MQYYCELVVGLHCSNAVATFTFECEMGFIPRVGDVLDTSAVGHLKVEEVVISGFDFGDGGLRFGIVLETQNVQDSSYDFYKKEFSSVGWVEIC